MLASMSMYCPNSLEIGAIFLSVFNVAHIWMPILANDGVPVRLHVVIIERKHGYMVGPAWAVCGHNVDGCTCCELRLSMSIM